MKHSTSNFGEFLIRIDILNVKIFSSKRNGPLLNGQGSCRGATIAKGLVGELGRRLCYQLSARQHVTDII